MPPRHGKSQLISRYFPAWYLSQFPDKRIILASYEAGFAAGWGRRARDILEEHGSRFGVRVREDSSAANRWDIAGHEGGMDTAGVGGPITGKGADVALIDDPIKNAVEAASEIIREKHWEWFHSTLVTRLHKGGSVVVVATRWHEDDMVGRLIKTEGARWHVLNLPAIAELDEAWPEVRWSRKQGDPLCPDLIPLEQLQERMKNDYWWAAQYQQRPYAKSGGMFKIDQLRASIVRSAPRHRKAIIRAWDLAATTKKYSKRTAGVRISIDHEGRYYIEHVVIGKWRPDERNQKLLDTTKADGRGVYVCVEQEGGSGGQDQALAVTKHLAGFRVRFVPVSGDKVLRADEFASQVNVGNVHVVDDGSWDVETFISELEAFPNSTYKDQVDAASLGFNELAKSGVPRAATSSAADTRAVPDEDDEDDPDGGRWRVSHARARDVANAHYPGTSPYRR